MCKVYKQPKNAICIPSHRQLPQTYYVINPHPNKFIFITTKENSTASSPSRAAYWLQNWGAQIYPPRIPRSCLPKHFCPPVRSMFESCSDLSVLECDQTWRAPNRGVQFRGWMRRFVNGTQRSHCWDLERGIGCQCYMIVNLSFADGLSSLVRFCSK